MARAKNGDHRFAAARGLATRGSRHFRSFTRSSRSESKDERLLERAVVFHRREQSGELGRRNLRKACDRACEAFDQRRGCSALFNEVLRCSESKCTFGAVTKTE